MMTIHSSESITVASTKLTEWTKTFSELTGTNVPSCIWITGNPIDTEDSGTGNHCIHYLFLPPEVDRYVRNWNPREPWSPWGQKSGPNFQFFEVLRQTGRSHPEEWLLQLETDVNLLRRPKTDDFGEELTESWIVGAHNHAAVLKNLDIRLWEHINGVAFYRVGNPGFRAFLEEVWKPSLLFLLDADPALAYDCATSPSIWGDLPGPLKNSWWNARDRFVRAPGMVNAASLTKREAEVVLASLSEGPWLFHGKTSNEA